MGTNHFRLVYLPAEEVLDKAMDRLRRIYSFFFLNCICVVGIETAAKKSNRYTKWFLLFLTLYFTLTSACFESNVYSKEKDAFCLSNLRYQLDSVLRPVLPLQLLAHVP